ncbi:DUF1565 domain-containing protein [Kitasatospora mediocidica]|uniref:DUF1565 domain-containing protein n=1 Tax=Kitasatospora mediocidica TaxID=58352 RepID=UPI000565A297|nr:right-handed parallel beta-helix repeat-containing protein [Kitasatospora mediocidica]
MLGAFALPAVGIAGASAAPTDLYVNNAAGANCSDAGTGAQGAPFCTVSAAAKVVLPGQTVHVAPGQYNEQVTLTRSGTAAAPITFEGAAVSGGKPGDGPGGPMVGPAWGAAAGHGLVISGAQYVTVSDLLFQSQGTGIEPVVVDNASNVTLLHVANYVGGTVTPAVRVTNGSSKVTVARSQLSAVVVDQGVTDTVLSTNLLGAVTVLGSPGTVVTSNTITNNCLHDGIDLAGASTGATVENNVIDTSNTNTFPSTACAAGATDTALSVSAAAASTAKVDYNVLSPVSGGTAYDWSGTAFKDQASFTAASGGQGTHDFVANPAIPYDGSRPAISPIIDSADENAPGELPVDAWDWAAKDDPLVPNTGTGSGIKDRGAQENQSFGSVYTPTGPTRVLDTRDGTGGSLGAVKGGGTVDLQVAGVGDVPASGVTAVTLNVTVTDQTSDGFLTVFPHGQSLPTASNLNWVAHTTVANLVTVPVVDGKISFAAGGGIGSTDVIADLAGYYSAKGSIFTPSGPTRMLDTRDGTGGAKGPAQPGGSVDLQIAGAAGIPATGVTAVTLNVTVTDQTSAGFLTVYPHGNTRPTASNLNWATGRTVANLVTVPVIDGKVSFATGGGTGTADVIADLAGYYSASGYTTYFPEGPWRAMDTREDFGGGEGPARPAGAIPPGGTLDIDFSGAVATAVTLNVTVTDPKAEGFLTVYPHGQALPTASNMNWVAGQTVANQVVVPVKDGKVSFHNSSSGSIQLVVDDFGRQSYQG